MRSRVSAISRGWLSDPLKGFNATARIARASRSFQIVVSGPRQAYRRFCIDDLLRAVTLSGQKWIFPSELRKPLPSLRVRSDKLNRVHGPG